MGTSKEGTVWGMPTGTQSAATSKLWNALGPDGARVWEQLNDDEIYLRYVAEQMILSKIMSYPGRTARAILTDKMFWGVEEWGYHYNVVFSRKDQLEIRKFPWGDDVLNSPCPFTEGKLIRDTHFVFLGLDSIYGNPLSVLTWRNIQNVFKIHTIENIDLEKDVFFKISCGFKWYLMPVAPVYFSACSYIEKVSSLPAEYEVSTATERVTQQILCGLLNNTGLIDSSFLCNDSTRRGYRVFTRLLVSKVWVGEADDQLSAGFGLSLSRKIPKS